MFKNSSSEVSAIWLNHSLPLLLICHLSPSRLIPYIHCTWVTIALSSPHPSILSHFTIHAEGLFNTIASQFLVKLSHTDLHLCCTSATHTQRPSCHLGELHIRQFNSNSPLSEHNLFKKTSYFHHICSLI